MTEMATEIADAPADEPKKRKPRHARANKRSAIVAPARSMMEGITVTDCPLACNEKKCVISGREICAHPHKGGLQANLQNADSMRRFNEAKRMLGKQKLDLNA